MLTLPKPKKIVMAGLDPATQCARVGARWRLTSIVNQTVDSIDSRGRADARPLGGRVKPGHDGFYNLAPRTRRQEVIP